VASGLAPPDGFEDVTETRGLAIRAAPVAAKFETPTWAGPTWAMAAGARLMRGPGGGARAT
jgi:hypothetical protein